MTVRSLRCPGRSCSARFETWDPLVGEAVGSCPLCDGELVPSRFPALDREFSLPLTALERGLSAPGALRESIARLGEVEALHGVPVLLGEVLLAWLQWMALLAAAQLREGGALGEAYEERLRTVLGARPSLGHWRDFLRESLRGASPQAVDRALADSWAAAGERAVVTREGQRVDTDGTSRSVSSKLSVVDALLAYRNRAVHEPPASAERLRAEVDEHLGLLAALLEGTAWLAELRVLRGEGDADGSEAVRLRLAGDACVALPIEWTGPEGIPWIRRLLQLEGEA